MADQLSAKDIAELRQLYKDLQGIVIPDMTGFIQSIGGVENARKNLEQMRKEMNNLNSDVSYFAESLTRSTLQLRNQDNALKSMRKSYSTLSSLATTLKNDQDGISDLNEKQVKSLISKISKERQNLELARKINVERALDIRNRLRSNQLTDNQRAALQSELQQIMAANAEITGFLRDQEQGFNTLLGAAQRRLALEKETQKAMGISGAVITGMANALQKAGLDSAINLGEVQEKMRETAKEAAEVARQQGRSVGFMDKMKVLGVGLKESFKSIAKSLTDPVTIITTLAAAAFKANVQTTDLAKSMGVTYNTASKTREQMVEFSRAAEDSYTNVDRLVKAQQELSNQLGFYVNFGNKNQQAFAKLTEIVGLSNEEGGKLAQNAAALGMEIQPYVDRLRMSAFHAQQTTKTHITDKQLLQEVSKLSASILLKFRNNPDALGKAIIKAKQLGTTLEDINKTTSSLLDFESSIQKQMEAELLTGKEINLDRARYYAMTGDTIGLAQELTREIGSLAEYQEMNVFQQNALAEAMGMNSEQVSEMLMKQEAINNYGSEAAKLNAQQLQDLKDSGLTLAEFLDKQATQRNIQERFNDAMTKLKDIIGNIAAGPLGKMVNLMAKLLADTKTLYPIIGMIGGAIIGKWVGGLAQAVVKMVTLLGQQATSAAIESEKAVAAITAAEAATLGAATFTIIGGIAGVVAAMMSQKSSASQPPSTTSAQDGYAAPGNGPFTITDRYGRVGLTSTGDGIAVTPNKPTAAPGGGGGIDMNAMLQVLGQIQSGIAALVDKPLVVNLDGEKVSNDIANKVPATQGNLLNGGARVYS